MARVAMEIPKVGLVMENARVIRWLKNVGDTVQQGEPLLEVETEKSVVEIEATESGRLVEVLLETGQEASVGDRIAWLETDAPEQAAAPQKPVTTIAATPTATSTPTGTPAMSRSEDGRIKSSPVARRLAAEHRLDLGTVAATGPNGRVQLIDVQRAVATPRSDAANSAANAPGVSGSQPLSNMRRALARSVALSNATIPQFAVARAVDWTAIQTARAEIRAQSPPAAHVPSANDFLLYSIARTLLKWPALNCIFLGDANSPDARILPSHGAHIGLVVAVEGGLLIPVFHDVERLGLADLARHRQETVARALAGKLKREELEGATLSVSNLGAHGPDRFTALINPPQSAILAVGRQRECVVAMDGSVQVKPMSELTLSVDHRVADGRLAADFLASVVEILQSTDWQLN